MEQLTYNNKILNIPKRYFHDNLLNRFKNNTYEKEEVRIIKTFFRNTDCVLELGSCIGYTACILSSVCKHVITVEANPELYEALSKTKTDNNLDNVELIFGYLDKEIKEIDFQTYDNVVAGSGDREDGNLNNVRGWGHTLQLKKIKTITLKEITNINNVDSLVVDIEGGELIFLSNFKTFIEKQIKKICIELHGHQMLDENFNNKCLNILNDIGFKVTKQDGVTYYLEKK